MQWLHFDKGSPDTLHFKHSAANGPKMFSKMTIKGQTRHGRTKTNFPQYFPPVSVKSISKPAKVKDLMDQIQYIPQFIIIFFKICQIIL